MSAGAKITQEELIAMFGSKMPAVAVNLLWEAPEGWSIGKVREELRKIAADQSRATESLGVSQGEQTASLLSRLKEAETELANLREWRWSFDPLTLTHAMVVGLLAEVNDNDAGRDLAETLEAVRDNLTVAARDLQAAEARIKVLEGALTKAAGSLGYIALCAPVGSQRRKEIEADAAAARAALLPQLGGENG